jgi:hypothetical protein
MTAIFLTCSRNLVTLTRFNGPDRLKRRVIRKRAVASGNALSIFR